MNGNEKKVQLAIDRHQLAKEVGYHMTAPSGDPAHCPMPER